MYDVAHLVALANMCRTAVFVYFSILKLFALAVIVLFYTYLLQVLLLYLLLYYLTVRSFSEGGGVSGEGPKE